MSNLKWADVAHYYLKSPIEVQKTFMEEFLTSNVGKKITPINGGVHPFNYTSWSFWSNGHSDKHVLSMTPILRHLEDMTEGERKELWRYVFSNWRNGNFSENALEFRGRSQFIKSTGSMTSDRWVMSQGVERLGIQSNGEVWADCDLHSFGFKSHLATHWLISKGFDVFGLIESGQAIRKGVENV